MPGGVGHRAEGGVRRRPGGGHRRSGGLRTAPGAAGEPVGGALPWPATAHSVPFSPRPSSPGHPCCVVGRRP
ncbi:hypothetical protein SCATT_54950 [Streptantibioticus cattleyicolor NRRL 8057 = DSM 46488]|uniref:Uncharacterized protein n=1 Tax=Streptantibioticus cattleyicolor (strain ATCC 35852 / DSM 46488 / JCM 4925 / NBRC 14057 / NRRL 8057) TaxID=1003195 RepID=G8WY94_STREN|nr:hypothetical protein SCATT_54950 [Streptantibioticus cattleyicolor NRRL 8057 = DSM 46488]